KFATRQHRLPERWLTAVEAAGTGMEDTVMIDRETAIEEMLMMGLRLVEGVSRKRLEETAGQEVERLFSHNLAPLIDGGFLPLAGEPLIAPAAARRRLNAVLAALLC